MPDTDLGVQGPSQSQNTVDHPHVLSGTRVVETLQLYPPYVIPLAALTVAFLVVELAFAAHLLDAVGGPISERQLTELAVWGWALSGGALTLLVWGSFLMPRSYRSEWSARLNFVAFTLSAIVCWETVYLVGPALTRHLEDRATASERQCAVQLRVLAMARQDSSAKAMLPAIRSALVGAPLAGLSCEGLPPASRDGLREALQGMVARRIGTAEQVYDNVFIPSVRSLRDAYNDYVVAQLRLVADIRAIPDQQAQAWQRFLDWLAQAGLSPTRVPRRDWPRTAAEARDMGVQVPPDWNPGDQSMFMEAVATAARKTADASYDDFVVKHFQQPLPPGLDWNGFCGQPAIQARWRAVIDNPAETTMTPNMGFNAFRQTIYDPRVDRLVRPLVDDLLDAPDRFGLDASQGQAGQAAIRWAIAPGLLLGVAMLCIFWHGGRLLDLACRVLLPRIGAPKRWAAEACVAALVILIMAWPTPHRAGVIASGSATQSAGACADAESGCETGIAVRVAWAVGSGLRKVILADFDFGYSPAAAGDLSGTALELLLPRVPSRP
jgi:hypothetical protein